MKKAILRTLLLGAVLCAVLALACAEDVRTSGSWQYVPRADGSAELLNYAGPGGEIVIPDELDGRTITAVRKYPFLGVHEKFTVSVRRGHPYLATIDGVLFGKTDWKLICCPSSLKLTEYRVPDGIERIGELAFYANTSLRSVTLPEGLKSLDSTVFYMCNKLERINLPYSLNEIADNPFCYCRALTTVEIPVGHPYLATIDGVLFTKPDRRLLAYPIQYTAKEYRIPEGIEAIAGYAFCGNESLQSVEIPAGVKTIGDYAFTICTGLRSVVIPEGVTSIGKGAFAANSSLTDVTIPASVTFIGEEVFYNVEDVTVHAPAGSYAERYCRDHNIACTVSAGGSLGDEDTDWLKH